MSKNKGLLEYWRGYRAAKRFHMYYGIIGFEDKMLEFPKDTRFYDGMKAYHDAQLVKLNNLLGGCDDE